MVSNQAARAGLRHPEQFSPFSLWLNSLNKTELDPQRYHFAFSDLDGLFFKRYREMALVFLLETKRQGKGVLSWSQHSILRTLDSYCRQNGGVVLTQDPHRGDEVVARYLGMHLLVMQGDSPDTSAWLQWGVPTARTPIELATLVKVLRFENDPRHPDQILDCDRELAYCRLKVPGLTQSRLRLVR